MAPVVTFETPENIAVSYPLAGPGTRFIAFVFDGFIILVSLLILYLIAVILGLTLLSPDRQSMGLSSAVLVSGLTVITGFIFIAYFGVCEWLMNGVTPGKSAMRIRVVMADGFSLSFTGVLLRSLFRLIDVIPVFWVVPVVSQREQRLGDMAGGTIVISEMPLPLHTIRTQLAQRPVEDARFTFTGPQLLALSASDLQAIELFLERKERLNVSHRLQLSERLVGALERKLDVLESVFPADRERFLEDLMAAHARKESRDVA